MAFRLQCRVLKSAQYPVLLVMEVTDTAPSEHTMSYESIPGKEGASDSSTRDNNTTGSSMEMETSASASGWQDLSHVFDDGYSRNNIRKDIKTKKKTFLFKMEDDLRQDEIVLQMFRFLDEAFKRAGLDLNLVFYDILPTGPLEGERHN
jgi:hypothetical protein